MSRSGSMALAAIMVLAAGLGFCAALPLSRLVPAQLEALGAAGVAVDRSARPVEGRAYLPPLPHDRHRGPGTALDWRWAGISLAPLGLSWTVRASGAVTGHFELVLPALRRRPTALIRGGGEAELGTVLAPGPAEIAGQLKLDLRAAEIPLSRLSLSSVPVFLAGGLQHLDAAFQARSVTLRFGETLRMGIVDGRLGLGPDGNLRTEFSVTGRDLTLRGTISFVSGQQLVLIPDLTVRPSDMMADLFLALLESNGTRQGDSLRLTRPFDLAGWL